MKALILAAGYATRLYPLTKEQPKPLLKVGDKPILEHIIDKIKETKIDEIFVVTNDKFYNHFQQWKKSYHSNLTIKVINDKTLTNEDRLGAIGDINYVVQEENINTDLLVIAGDNLFGFSLKHYLDTYKGKTLVALRDLHDLEKVKGKFGVAILEGNKIVDFEEKPMDPRSSLAATACYIFNKEDLKEINNLLTQGKADNPGDLIKWLVKESEVQAFVFDEEWYDIGTFEALEEARERYS